MGEWINSRLIKERAQFGATQFGFDSAIIELDYDTTILTDQRSELLLSRSGAIWLVNSIGFA